MSQNNLSRRNALRLGGAAVAGGALAASSAAPANAVCLPPLFTSSCASGGGGGGGGNQTGVKVGPKSVCYVEVNDHSMLNVGKYKLANSGKNVFDIGIIFASNINKGADGKAVLHHNTQVTALLNDVENQVRPLQNQGIKVLLSILGNHQGVGPGNFQTYEDADAFAAQLADCVYTYGLDGVDFDDEYARYDLGHPVNDWSFPYLCDALRKRMPDKIISLYWYGPITNTLEYDGIRVGDRIDYSWNAIYGTWIVPNVPGLTKEQLSPAAIKHSETSSATANSLATSTVNEAYGVYLTYDLRAGDHSAYISGFTRRLNDEATVYTG